MTKITDALFFGTNSVFDFVYLTSVVNASAIENCFHQTTILGKKIKFQVTKIQDTVLIGGSIGTRTVLITNMNGLWLIYYNDHYNFEGCDVAFMRRFISSPGTIANQFDTKRRDTFDQACELLVRTAGHQ